MSDSVTTETTAAQATPDYVSEREEGRQALKELLKPVQGSLMIGRILAGLSGVLAIAPYIALVQLGGLFATAYATGQPVDADRAMLIVQILISTFCLRIFLLFIALGVTHFADARFVSYVRARTIERVGNAPLGWFTSTNSGRIRKALHDDVAQIHTMVAHQPVEMTQAMIMPVALLIYAFYVDWRLGLLSIATLPLYGLFMAWMMSGMGPKTVEMDAKLARVSATMVELVTGITVVKAFGKVGQAHGNYQQAADEFAIFYNDWTGSMIKGSALANVAISVPVLLLVNVGGGSLMVNAGWVSATDVLSTTLIALALPYGIELLGNSTWAYQIAGAAALRVTTTLKTPVLGQETEAEQDIHGSQVVFDKVSFAYDDTQALRNVSLTLSEGTVTALVGPSGSGKSTLATLLARFNDPDSGSITLGGVDLRNIPTGQLYRNIGFVLQDPQLLRMSIRDNIALGRPDATDTEVRAAAVAACIADRIDALPDGFDTMFGSGINLSGGEQQRVAIARALLVDAPVLILDEATAFTDPESEAEIQKALTTLVRGRTVLVIAHRPESILGVDQIAVLDHGNLVACGAPNDVIDHPLFTGLAYISSGHNAEDLS